MLAAPASYIDFDGLAQLGRTAAHDSAAALDTAATEFEAQMIGMMLKTAREAKLADGLFDSSQSEQYLELMDQQVALELARRGTLGLRSMLIEQLGGAAAAEPAPAAGLLPAAAETPESFVGRHAAEAEAAAAELGVDPKLLLAQAALETGWGRSLAHGPAGQSSNNLFGIKASRDWDGDSVSRWTVEFRDGVAERRRETFRSYPTAAESFADYVGLVKESFRHATTEAADGDPAAFARALVDGGYATDPDYLDKWLAIYDGDTLGDAMAALK